MHARSNRKAVGGDVLIHAQSEAAEAGPSPEVQAPSFCQAPRVRKDAEARGGPGGGGLRARGGRGPAARGGGLPRMREPAKLPSVLGTGLLPVLVSS